MIFEQTLRRELSFTAGAVFLILLTFVLTTLVIRILNTAISGKANPNDVLLLIGLTTLDYLAILLYTTLFILVLLMLTRWCKDSEMVVWFTSNIDLTDFIRPVLRFSLPFIMLVALPALFGWPWTNQQSTLFRNRFEQCDVLSIISAGCFIEPTHGNYVLSIEDVDSDMKHARGLFVANTKQDEIGVAVTKAGEFKTMPDGDRFVVLNKDRRYKGAPGKLDYCIVEFDKYGVKATNKPPQADANLPTKSRSIKDLPADPTPEDLGELVWRIGLPLLALNFMLTATPLAYINPRPGRYTPMTFAVLVYLTYSSLLNLPQAWVSQGKMNVSITWWPIHLATFIYVMLLFRFRHYSAAGLKSISILLGFAPKEAGA